MVGFRLSPLLDLARRGQRITPPLLAMGLTLVGAFAALFGGSILASLLLRLLFPGGSEPAFAYGLVSLVAVSASIFALVWAWVRGYERRPFWTLGMELGGALSKYLRGLALGVLMFAAAVLVMVLLGDVAEEPSDPALQGTAALGGVLVVYLAWMVQGPAEELLCRGFLLQAVGVRYGAWAGVIVSSAFFALMHSLNPHLSPIAVLNLFLIGVFLALWALREGSLWGVFAWHSAWNWAQGNLFGYQVSGGSLGGGSLLDFHEAGPNAITGGAFGPEGGVAVTAVIAVAILALLVRSKGGPKGVLVLALTALLAASCSSGTADSELRTMTIDNPEGEKVEVHVEIADDASEREQGLMGRTELGENRGMLFVFKKEHKLSFWMKDTRIPLSIAFIDSEGRIVDIQQMKPFDDELPNYISAKPVRYALEVNRGFFDERGVEVGDKAELPKM